MILDTQATFSEAQAFTATGDTASTNVYDTGLGATNNTAVDIGAGEEMYIFAKTVAAVTSGGAATVQLVLQDSADNSTFADVMTLTPAALQAALTANLVLVRARLPVGLRRYLRVVYRVGTAVLTAGSFSAYIVKDVQAQQYGTSGFTVA